MNECGDPLLAFVGFWALVWWLAGRWIKFAEARGWGHHDKDL